MEIDFDVEELTEKEDKINVHVPLAKIDYISTKIILLSGLKLRLKIKASHSFTATLFAYLSKPVWVSCEKEQNIWIYLLVKVVSAFAPVAGSKPRF